MSITLPPFAEGRMLKMLRLIKLLALLSFLFLWSCSVFMAAKKEGVSIDELNQCRTRSCIISKGAIPIDAKKNEIVAGYKEELFSEGLIADDIIHMKTSKFENTPALIKTRSTQSPIKATISEHGNTMRIYILNNYHKISF